MLILKAFGLFVLTAVATAVGAKAAQSRPVPRHLLLAPVVWVPGIAAAGAFALTRLSAIQDSFKLTADARIGSVLLGLHALNMFATGLSAGAGLVQAPPWNQLEKIAALAAVPLIARG